jgi:hypothetical protein
MIYFSPKTSYNTTVAKEVGSVVSTIPANERRAMSKEEIRKAFDGRWIFLTHIQDNPYSAIPVIIADTPYEGSEEGIYQEYLSNDIYGTTGHTSLLLCASMTGFEVY